jgi:FMNH2-dependent dimethyl sulfone monooxygenase
MMRFGYWLPVFGGWLRNVPDEGMEATWEYSKRLAQRSEQLGYDLSLIAELNLNDIKGVQAPSLDAWSTAAALMAVTQSIEWMVAVRPAQKYGVQFEQHDRRYQRTSEWLDIIDSLWTKDGIDYHGEFYQIKDSMLQPKPLTKPRPTIYAGGESEAAKDLIAAKCDAYLMHGDPPERVAAKIQDMRARRDRLGLPPMTFGLAVYAITRNTQQEALAEVRRITDVNQSNLGYENYQQWLSGTQLERRVSLEDYSVSNRGLQAGLVGSHQQVQDRIGEFQAAGVDLLLLQCSPQIEEMERFSECVIRHFGQKSPVG